MLPDSTLSVWSRRILFASVLAVVSSTLGFVSDRASATELSVLRTGLGSGSVTSSPTGIDCGGDCQETYGSAQSVTLTASAEAGSKFLGWDIDPSADPATAPDCAGTSTTCTISMGADRSVRPTFGLDPAIPTLTDFAPEGIAAYLAANPAVNSPARFLAALPDEFRQHWILMSRSESLQSGTAESPRILLPSADARFVFAIGMAEMSSYPASQWPGGGAPVGWFGLQTLKLSCR